MAAMNSDKQNDIIESIPEKDHESDLEKLNRELMQELDSLESNRAESRRNQNPDNNLSGDKKDGKKKKIESKHSSHRHRTGRKRTRGRKRKRKKRKIRPFHIAVALLGLIIVLLAGTVTTLLIFRALGEAQLKESIVDEEVRVPEDAEMEDNGKIVIYKGQRYRFNENIISILCMGVDKTIQETGDDSIGANGQADAIFLATLDTESGEFNIINISRDSMVDVNRYNIEGKYLDTEEMQICLAYSYGDGKETSCLNTARSVSRLLYGMPIHAWAAMDYSGINVLNEYVGGVKVNVLEDLSDKDPQLTPGNEVTLNGQQAVTYVRYRNTAELDSNNQRMARQRQYLTSFIQTAVSRTREDIMFPLSLYQNALEYMSIDIDSKEVVYLASLAIQQGFSEGDMYPVPGQVVQGEKYAEFIPDETALYELILDVFYNKEN